MSVNQYRRINFWTAILGQILSPFPAFFDGGRIYGKTRLAKFPDNRANRHIFILLFTPLLGIKRRARLIGIKRRARLIKKAHGAWPCGATSSRVKQSVFTESRSGVAPVARYV
ncbi:DUF2684 family protein [Klebsiella pneumoniae]|nr:DUF2684 family protein [Klebsiella pneumoniae]RRE86078.1 DUF2684 family protein [Klebsiella pneumoniae]